MQGISSNLVRESTAKAPFYTLSLLDVADVDNRLGVISIGLYHPLDGTTNHKYKLMHFLTTKYFFCNDKKTLAFNRDRCCHLALCLQLILLTYRIKTTAHVNCYGTPKKVPIVAAMLNWILRQQRLLPHSLVKIYQNFPISYFYYESSPLAKKRASLLFLNYCC